MTYLAIFVMMKQTQVSNSLYTRSNTSLAANKITLGKKYKCCLQIQVCKLTNPIEESGKSSWIVSVKWNGDHFQLRVWRGGGDSGQGLRGGQAHCTLHTAHSTQHTAYCTLHTAHCTLHAARCILHTAHYKMHNSNWTLNSAHCTLHVRHCTVHTTHCIL